MKVNNTTIIIEMNSPAYLLLGNMARQQLCFLFRLWDFIF